MGEASSYETVAGVFRKDPVLTEKLRGLEQCAGPTLLKNGYKVKALSLCKPGVFTVGDAEAAR